MSDIGEISVLIRDAISKRWPGGPPVAPDIFAVAMIDTAVTMFCVHQKMDKASAVPFHTAVLDHFWLQIARRDGGDQPLPGMKEPAAESVAICN